MIQQPIEVEHQNMTIRGTAYRPAAEGRHPTVLFLHGFTGQRVEAGFVFVQLARILAKRGIATVTFDFRHSGESDGSFDQMLVSGELSDAVRMTEWVQGQPFVDRSKLGLLGFSLGGLVAGCLLGKTNVYQAVALMAPTTAENLVGNVCKRPSNDCATDQPVTTGAYVLHRDFLADTLQHKPTQEIVKHPRPTLLVQGTLDTAVPPTTSQKYVDALKQANIPVQHELIEGCDHGFGTPAVRARLLEIVPAFFAGQLQG